MGSLAPYVRGLTKISCKKCLFKNSNSRKAVVKPSSVTLVLYFQLALKVTTDENPLPNHNFYIFLNIFSNIWLELY